jgi:hypothetical protein
LPLVNGTGNSLPAVAGGRRQVKGYSCSPVLVVSITTFLPAISTVS